MKRSAALAVATALAVSGLPRTADADDDYGPTFPIAISVATKEGTPAASHDWIASQIEAANELFGPIGIHFRWLLEKQIPAAHFEMHSRADRDALAPFVEKNVIDVFVVSELEDVDERGGPHSPRRLRKGVAWTNKTAGRRYLILSAAAPRGVLTHELGHFFGNAHTDVPDNLMSYSRTQGGTVFLDESQIARSRELATRFLTTSRLFDAGPARRLP